eukprot:5557949-Amphidinium_carterae.1
MLHVDAGSFARAAAAKEKGVMLERLAQHVGDTGVLRNRSPDCPDPASQIFERPPRPPAQVSRPRRGWEPHGPGWLRGPGAALMVDFDGHRCVLGVGHHVVLAETAGRRLVA